MEPAEEMSERYAAINNFAFRSKDGLLGEWPQYEGCFKPSWISMRRRTVLGCGIEDISTRRRVSSFKLASAPILLSIFDWANIKDS